MPCPRQHHPQHADADEVFDTAVLGRLTALLGSGGLDVVATEHLGGAFDRKTRLQDRSSVPATAWDGCCGTVPRKPWGHAEVTDERSAHRLVTTEAAGEGGSGH
jgi:hypothetical protein